MPSGPRQRPTRGYRDVLGRIVLKTANDGAQSGGDTGVLRTRGSRLVGEVFAGRGCVVGGCGTGVLPVSVSTKIFGRTSVETDPTRMCQLLVGLPDVVVFGVDACAGDAPQGSVTHGPGDVGGGRGFLETTADQRFGPASPSHEGHRSHPRLRCGPHLMAEMGHKPHKARRGHHIGAAEGLTAPAAALM